MRALLITLLLAALGVGGYFLYRHNAPAASAPMFSETPPIAPAPTAEDCTVTDAFYEYNDDPRLQLRFRRLPSPTGQAFEVAEMQGRVVGNMAFVIHATTFGADYVFVPINGGATSGPLFDTAVTYIRPDAGGAPIAVSMFDSEMRYQGQLPRNDTPAPRYVFMPGVLPVLYRARIDQPPGMFTFRRCAPQQPTTAPSAPASQ